MRSGSRCKRFIRSNVSQQSALIHSSDPGIAATNASEAIVAAIETGDLPTGDALETALLRSMDVRQGQGISLAAQLDFSAAAHAYLPVYDVRYTMIGCHCPVFLFE